MSCEPLTADVLVIGGGLAGCWAAIAAARSGAAVLLAEKGYTGTSGVAATAGPGHWWVPPEPGLREAAVAKRLAAGQGLGDGGWMARIIDLTFRTLPTLAGYYQFPRNDRGEIQYRALRGPEYLRALRRMALDCGVRLLDQSPALELLLQGDGRVAGARGLRRQSGGEWEVRSGAVVLASGGCAFRSRLLGAANNTGDGLLMAAEAGCGLSGMEFSTCYTVAPANTTMTRSMSYAFATYYDEAGHVVPVPAGPDSSLVLARALGEGRVFCDLSRMPEDIRRRLPQISPNVMLPFRRLGIDPFSDRFEITLHGEGTIRGIGGLRIDGEDCRTSVPGLFAAGDVATRESVTGAVSGGGAVNSAWALSSGHWAGQGAASHAAATGTRTDKPVLRIGEAGLRPRHPRALADARALAASVQEEMLPPQRSLFHTRSTLDATIRRLDGLWDTARDSLGVAWDPSSTLRHRETAAMIATARWCAASALARDESRGMHRRADCRELSAETPYRVHADGLDRHRTQRVSMEAIHD